MARLRHPHGHGIQTRGLPFTHGGEPVEAQGTRLIALADLDERGVSEVRTAEHGVLAVGLAGGEPFAVSNVCRHQLGKLGAGRVTEEGCLECPGTAPASTSARAG